MLTLLRCGRRNERILTSQRSIPYGHFGLVVETDWRWLRGDWLAPGLPGSHSEESVIRGEESALYSERDDRGRCGNGPKHEVHHRSLHEHGVDWTNTGQNE